jgi:ankyrin repeat protein
MRDNKPNKFHLLEAAHQGDVVLAKWALFSGVDANSTDRYGVTALHTAALKDSVSIAKLLLTVPQTDLEKPDMAGNTPLDLARRFDCKKVARMIKDEMCKRERIRRNGARRWDTLFPKSDLGS